MNKLLVLFLLLVVPCVTFAGQAADSSDLVEISEAQFALSDSASPPILPTDQWHPVMLPHYWKKEFYEKGRSGWYSLHLQLKAPPVNVRGIYLPKLSMNAAVFLNGQFIGDGGTFDEPVARNWNRPLLFTVPPALWRSGENIIDVHLKGYPYDIQLSPLQVGDIKLLQRQFELRKLLQNDISAILFPETLTVSFFMFALWVRRRKDTSYLWFALSVLMWSIFSLNLFIHDIPLSAKAWDWVAYGSLTWWTIFLAIFSHRFLKRKRKVLESIYLLFGVSGGLALAFAELGEMNGVAVFWYSGSILLGFYTAFQLLRHWKVEGSRESGVMGLGIAIVLLTAIHDWIFQSRLISSTGFAGFHLNHYSAPIIFMIMAWHLIRRFITALDESEALNRELENRVDAARSEIEISHAQMREMETKQLVADERERISREIHDGLGGNFSNGIMLVDLILRGATDKEARLLQLKKLLSEGFAELRNVILTMEGEMSTMGKLSTHIGEKTEEVAFLAGLECRIDNSLINEQRTVPHTVSLNLLRIFQEALTNTIKYGDAKTITVNIKDDAEKITFEIKDDGRGFDSTQRSASGHGLKNMERRCREINAGLNIQSVPGAGTSITVELLL